MRFLVAIIMIAVMSVPAGAQEVDVEAVRAEMKKLDFLVGEWKGSGWMQRGKERETFDSHEQVRRRVQDLALLIEGNHTGFEALGLATYDAAVKSYQMRTCTSEGRTVDAGMKLLGPSKLQWGFPVPGGQIRYSIEVLEGTQWVEVGEFSRDGEIWRKFFEMKLTRQKGEMSAR